MNINDAFPSNYLKASDLRGAQVNVTIDRVEFEPVGRDREMKPILYFVGKEKGMVMNKTNATAVMRLTGSSHTEDWQQFQICIYPTHVEFGGEQVEAIRIKAAKPTRNGQPVAPPPPPPEPIDESDVPF